MHGVVLSISKKTNNPRAKSVGYVYLLKHKRQMLACRANWLTLVMLALCPKPRSLSLAMLNQSLCTYTCDRVISANKMKHFLEFQTVKLLKQQSACVLCVN